MDRVQNALLVRQNVLLARRSEGNRYVHRAHPLDGSIEQIDLSKAFTQRDNRRTAGMTGQPPTREGLTVIPGAPGVSKPLFMKER
jgi:hypothetical protein